MFSSVGRLFPESVTSALDGLFKHSASSLSGALSAVQSLSLDKWVQIGALSNYSLLSLVSVHQLYRGLTAAKAIDESAVRVVLQQRESAVSSYQKATEEFNCGSYGAAMTRMEIALAEFIDAPLKKYNLTESKIDIALKAEMFQFYGIVLFHYSQNDTFIIKALESLQRASRLDASLVLTHNMMAFMQFYYMNDHDCARTHLMDSIKLNGRQLFARYYLARLNRDDYAMHSVITELMHLCESPSDQASEWRNLQASTLLFMLPHMLTDCLSYCAAHMKDPRALSKLVEVCAYALSRQPSDILKLCSITIAEARMIALQRMAKLKRDATIFDSFDLKCLKDNCFSLDDGVESYFFEVPAKQFYQSILGCLGESADLDFLILEPYAERTALIISDWIAHGWLSEDANPDIQSICALNRKTKHLTGDLRTEAHEEIVRLCRADSVIKYFVSQYLSLNWENICRVSSANPTVSVLRLLCEHAGITFNMYNKGHARTLTRIEDSTMIPQQHDQPAVHVTYDAETNQFCLLEELTAPSMLYSRLAMRDAWLLLQKDVNHQARDMLIRKGAVNVPGLRPAEKAHNDASFIKLRLIESDLDGDNTANLPNKSSQSGRVSMLTFIGGGALLLAAASATVVLSRKISH